MSSHQKESEVELLQRRAQELSRAVELRDRSTLTRQFAAFTLSGDRYAVPLQKVEAVARVTDVYVIPGVPRHISGVIRRRGSSMALISLRRFFGADSGGLADADFALVVNAGGKRFALEVEDIEGVISLEESELLSPPDNLATTQAPFISYVTLQGITVLDPDRLVAFERFGVGAAAEAKPVENGEEA